jgi:hypothetical protein
MKCADDRFHLERPATGSHSGEHVNDNHTTSTTAVQLVETEDDALVCLDASFHYDPADAFAVTMVVDSIAGPVRWTFARELILNGMFEPTGDGDVHVWPCLDTRGAAVVIVELETPEGGTLLQFPARPIHEFVASSLAAVPEGAEQLDVDGWLVQLLGETD